MLFAIAVLVDHCCSVVVDSHAHLDKPVIGADLAQVTGNRIHHPKALSLFSQVLGEVGQDVVDVTGIVEKPAPELAPTTLAVAGRYILTPGIFHELENIPRGVGGEIQLTDGIAQLLRREKVFAYRYEGTRYDCGSKLGFLQATVDHQTNCSSVFLQCN